MDPDTNVVVVVVVRFSKYYNFSVSQLIVIKLRLLIGDNIPDFRIVSDFYRAKRSVAQRGIAMISCLSVRPSMTLVDCDHTRWYSAKIISRLISLGTWLSADPDITDILQREHP